MIVNMSIIIFIYYELKSERKLGSNHQITEQ